MKISKQQYILFSIALLLGAFFHFDTIFEYPKFIHAWAQADRYALALNFLWNDFNFIEAETYLHNIEFPMGFSTPKEDSITMVNFPIHEYIIALLMKITGVTAPVIFRFYIFCCSLVGLIYVSKFGKLFNLSFPSQVLLLLFTATSPVFVYYQDNFIPSIPAFSMSLMGIYYYILYLRKPNYKLFALCIVLLTISSLYRTTFIIPQIAIFGVEFIRVLRKNAKLSWLLSLLVVSGIALYLHRLHNENQIHTYGSIFLYYIVPALNWSEGITYLKQTFENWHFDYLNVAQLILLLVLSTLGIRNLNTFKPKGDFKSSIFLFILACLTGYLMFTIAMLSKFPHHDYYFIDTYFSTVILLLILLLGLLEKSFPKIILSRYYFGFVILFGITTIFLGSRNLTARTMDNEWDYSSELVDIYACGDQILDSLEIPKEAKLMVFGPQYPNLPLILLNRKGYTLFGTKDWEVIRALTWDFDYIILPNQYFLKEFYSLHPDLINRFNKIYDNGKFSICTLKEEGTSTSLKEFFQLKDNNIVFQIKENFENNKTVFLTNSNYTSEYALSGHSSSEIKPNEEYALLFESNSIKGLETYTTKLMINSNFLVYDTLKRLEFIVNIQDKKGNHQFYETFHLQNIYKKSKQWNSFELIYQLPKLIEGEYIFKAYYWNRDQANLAFDDIEYRFYK
jgi:hypothetical protein